MLNDNAKLIVTEQCEGADIISSHIPNATVVTQDRMALALPDTKVNQKKWPAFNPLLSLWTKPLPSSPKCKSGIIEF